MRIVGILLAAGRGERFGGDKLVAPLTDPAMPASDAASLGAVSGAHLAAALTDVIAVVRPGDDPLAEQLRAAGLDVVECARAGEGMGASLACGVGASSDADGWVVALADMPWIARATIENVAAALVAGADIVAPSFRGLRGHPVGFSRRHYAALAALTGDAGARQVIERGANVLTLIDVDDPGVLRDVDTRDDL